MGVLLHTQRCGSPVTGVSTQTQASSVYIFCVYAHVCACLYMLVCACWYVSACVSMFMFVTTLKAVENCHQMPCSGVPDCW